jgi:hypothetical protein
MRGTPLQKIIFDPKVDRYKHGHIGLKGVSVNI